MTHLEGVPLVSSESLSPWLSTLPITYYLWVLLPLRILGYLLYELILTLYFVVSSVLPLVG